MMHPSPTQSAAPQAMPAPPPPPPAAIPIPRSPLEMSSIILAVSGVVFGISSIGATAAAWNPSTYSKDGLSGASAAAITLGFFCLVMFGVATPILSCAAHAYQKRNQIGNSTNGGNKGLMITSWVAYGIMMVLGICAIILGAVGGDVTPALVVFIVIIATCGWLCMMGHAHISRITTSVGVKTSVTYGRSNPQEKEEEPAMPTTSTVPPVPMPDIESQQRQQQPTCIVSESVTEEMELDGSRKVTATLLHPDGSKTVKVTKYPPPPQEVDPSSS